MSIAHFVVGFALVSQNASPRPSDERAPVRSPEGALVDAYLTRLEAFGFQGAVLVAKEGEVVFERGYGLADELTGRRNSADTPFLIASVAKPLVSLAILLLESEGQISIDDPLHLYFDVPPDKEGITLRQLLSHTSGLNDFYRDLSPELSDEEYIRAMLMKPLIAQPGSRFRYSNFGYDLLRDLVRRASGSTWEEFLREEVYEPAGMDRTGFFLPDWSAAEVARYQDRGLEGSPRYPARPLDLTEPHVCTLSTVGDLYRLHLALEAGSPLSHEAQRRAYSEVREGYALGWRTARTMRNTRVLYHGGYDTAFGVVSGLYRYVDEDVVLVFLGNTHMGGMLAGEYLARELEALLFGGNVLLPPAVSKTAGVVPAEVAGTYELDDGQGVIEIVESTSGLLARSEDEFGILWLLFPDAAGPAGSVVLDEGLARLIDEALVAGNLEQLEHRIWSGSNVEAWRSKWRSMREQMLSQRGQLLGRRALHTRSFERADEPETQVYVLLEFERGVEVLRALRNEEGRWWIDHVPRPGRVELALAPTGAGEYRTWPPRLAASSRLRFLKPEGDEPARLELAGRRSRVALSRR